MTRLRAFVAVAVLLSAYAVAQVVPSGGGFSIAGQGQLASGKTVRCSPASPTDAGCVTADNQTFAGVKNFTTMLVLDGGSGFPLKVRSGICIASTALGVDNQSATCTNGASLTSPTSGQINLMGLFDLNSSGAYYTTPLLTNTTYNAYGTGATAGLSFYNGSYIDLAGVATGSLPTCNAGNAGVLQYDTTTGTYKWCNGTAFASMSGTVTATTNTWSTTCFGVPCSGEAANFTGASRVTVGTGTTQVALVCSWNVVGTGGTTGVVARIRNNTDGTTLCTCTLGACTTAINTPLECNCSGTFTAAKIYTMQLDSTTDCTTNPGQIICTVATTTTSN